MTDRDDPPRLLDESSGAPEGLRELLRAAERDVGSTEQTARLAAKLGPLLDAPTPAPAPSPATSGLSALAKLGLPALALLLAGGGAWVLSTSRSASPPAPIPRAAPHPVTRVPEPPQLTVPVPAAPSPVPAAPSVRVASPEASAPVKTHDKPATAAQPSEAELLEQARAALRGDPARALARANEHRRRFPRGVLVQEREVIAIQALRHLGRAAEAEQRAAAFEKSFPGSAFQRKLKPNP